MRRDSTTRPRARTRAALAALACVFMSASIAAMSASGATSGIVVTMDVPSATTLNTTQCAPGMAGRTDFGVVLPGTMATTTNDCTVSWGSSNDQASLRLAQSDGIGSAMVHPTDAWNRTTGVSSRIASMSTFGGTTLAINSSGVPYQSLDGGVTWTTLGNAGGAGNSYGISMGSASTAWVTTNTTVVRRSTNANLAAPTWSSVTAPGMAQTRAVVASSASTAWVVGSGGTVSKTTTSGASWTNYATPVATTLNEVNQLDADSLVAWGNAGTIVATSDGTTWRDISISTGTAVGEVWPITDDTMYALVDNAILRTTNATAATPTWTNLLVDNYERLDDVVFTDATHGYAFGRNGVMLTTANGTNWTRSDTDSVVSVGAATALAADTFLVAGAGNQIVRSNDTGDTWTQRNSGTNPTWMDVSMTTDGTGWRVGGWGAIERTTDAGTSWTSQGAGTTPNDLLAVHAFDTQRVVAVGRKGTVVTTSDGGTTWTVRSSGVAVDLFGLDGTDRGRAWAAGGNGTILRSTDRGRSWSTQSTTPGATLLAVAAVDDQRAMAFGQDGVARRTTDGSSWNVMVLPTGSYSVRAADVLRGTDTVGYVGNSRFVRSDDGGATWAIRTPGATLAVTDLAFVSAQQIEAVTVGVVYRSVDGGTTWTQPLSGCSSNCVTYHWASSVDAVDRSTAVTVGDGNLTGVTGSSDPVNDYQSGVSDWTAGTEAFGACLRATSATPTWTVNGTCPQTNGAWWRGVPTTTGIGSEVASAASIAGTQTADIRFGLRVDPAQPPGELSAGLTFLVIAPNA